MSVGMNPDHLKSCWCLDVDWQGGYVVGKEDN